MGQLHRLVDRRQINADRGCAAKIRQNGQKLLITLIVGRGLDSGSPACADRAGQARHETALLMARRQLSDSVGFRNRRDRERRLDGDSREKTFRQAHGINRKLRNLIGNQLGNVIFSNTQDR